MVYKKYFVLTTNFGSFLSLVYKRKWLNVLKKNQHMPVSNLEQTVLYVEDESFRDWKEIMEAVGRENAVISPFNTLGERCQEIIKRCIVENIKRK